MTETAAELDLRPNPAVLMGAGGALALVSAAFLPWPVAIASTLLGMLMIAGADVDARTFLLPDVVTVGATLAGIVAAPLIEPIDTRLEGAEQVALDVLRRGLQRRDRRDQRPVPQRAGGRSQLCNEYTSGEPNASGVRGRPEPVGGLPGGHRVVRGLHAIVGAADARRGDTSGGSISHKHHCERDHDRCSREPQRSAGCGGHDKHRSNNVIHDIDDRDHRSRASGVYQYRV